MIWTVTKPTIEDGAFNAVLVPDNGKPRDVSWPVTLDPLDGPLRDLIDALFADGDEIPRARWEQTGKAAGDNEFWDGFRFEGAPSVKGCKVVKAIGWPA